MLICTELLAMTSPLPSFPQVPQAFQSPPLTGSPQATAGDAQLSLVQSLCGLLFTGNFHVYPCLPQKKDLWVDASVSSVHSAPCKMPWWKPRGAANGWMAEAQIPGKPPRIFPPLLSWLMGALHGVTLVDLGESLHGPKGTGSYPRTALLQSSELGSMAGLEGRVSHHFRNTEFCPNYSLSFKIPPPDVFQASHFSGVTRQRGLFLPLPLDSCEEPGRVSTLTEAPARQSPGVPRDLFWPLPGYVPLS